MGTCNQIDGAMVPQTDTDFDSIFRIYCLSGFLFLKLVSAYISHVSLFSLGFKFLLQVYKPYQTE